VSARQAAQQASWRAQSQMESFLKLKRPKYQEPELVSVECLARPERLYQLKAVSHQQSTQPSAVKVAK
jgi:hypothetical protein